eukprot:6829719-Prymnesium_polylepis.1
MRARLDGRSTAELREILRAPDDLSEGERGDEPLFTPPSRDDGGAEAGGSAEAEDGADDLQVESLVAFDAATLRALKGVSRAWRRCARAVLGDPLSAWRRRPVWASRPHVAALAARLGEASPQARLAAVQQLSEAAEPVVELPAFAPALVQRLEE